MEWRTGVRQAFEELAHHKLRTLLTLLGMIFGVGAVIAMLSVGEGAKREALAVIDTMGLRTVLVRAIPQPEDKLKEVRADSLGLSLRDLDAARETLPFIEKDSAVKAVKVYSLFSHAGKSDARVLGVSPSHFDMGRLAAKEGRLLLPIDDQLFAQVCVLGGKAARDLFGAESPVGQLVKVNQLWLTVVGVLADRTFEKDEFEGVKLQSSDHEVYLPIRTALKKLPFKALEDELDEIQLEIREGVASRDAATTLSRLMETRHRGINDYALVVPEALLEQHTKTQRIFNVVMGCIAAISLLVGGIGIMNIMLATVLERTREIGIRRALGARRSDIQRQFLTETLAITGLGGALGIIAGFVMAETIGLLSGWAVAWPLSAVILAVGVSGTIGLVFGIYPAIQAAKLDPIEALRRETV